MRSLEKLVARNLFQHYLDKSARLIALTNSILPLSTRFYTPEYLERGWNLLPEFSLPKFNLPKQDQESKALENEAILKVSTYRRKRTKVKKSKRQ